jgi:hypothetical protein
MLSGNENDLCQGECFLKDRQRSKVNAEGVEEMNLLVQENIIKSNE